MVSQISEIRNLCVQTQQLEPIGICTYTLTEENMPVCGKSYRITVTLDNANLHLTESVRDVTTIPDIALRLFLEGMSRSCYSHDTAGCTDGSAV